MAEHVEPQLMPAGELVTVPVPGPPSVTDSFSDPVSRLNVAVTFVFSVSTIVHTLVPLHAPLHPAKEDPDAGAAVSVTLVSALKVALHVEPQLMPAGALVTVPRPEPARVTERVSALVSRLKVAVTAVLLVRVTVHLPVPEHAPDHPAKADPEAGEAVSVTLVFWSNVALHVEPQLIPVGELITVPTPVPASDTLNLLVEVGETPKPPQPPNAAIKTTIRLRDAARTKYEETMCGNRKRRIR